MRSPRFPLREPTLKALFSVSSIKRTWKDKIRIAVRERYVPDPIEFLDFHVSLDSNSRRIESMISNGQYRPRRPLRILLEKSKGLCRQIVMPDVVDAIVLQRLSDSLYKTLRGKSPSQFAFFEPDNFNFWLEKGRNGEPLYGSFAAWLHFQRELFNGVKSKNYTVVTDIANYYDFIGYTNLRNVISSYVNPSEAVLDLLIYSLSGLTWQPDYMPRVEIGLPQIDLDAPRVLAHSFLFDLDTYAESQKDALYTRYMDDINFSTDSIYRAKELIRDVDLILHTRQVRLNSGKTRIMSSVEAMRYFRVVANKHLDEFQRSIDEKIIRKDSLVKHSRVISSLINKKYHKGYFDDGYGDKILKRMLSISRQVRGFIDHGVLDDILRRRPNVRLSVYKYVSSFPLSKSTVTLLANGMLRREAVDAASFLFASNAFVETLCPSDRLKAEIQDATLPMNSKVSVSDGDGAVLYAKLWIMSKYGDESEIIEAISRHYDAWRVSPHLGRLVGGMTPRINSINEFKLFRNLIVNSNNSDAINVLEFHERLSSTGKMYGAVRRFISAPNGSKPLKITHAKFLMLLSVFRNPHVLDKEKLRLAGVHILVWQDAFYRKHALEALPAGLHASVPAGR